MEYLLGRNKSKNEGEHWLSISDLMAGLMMVFLFISIALMRSAFIERDQIKQIAVAHRESQVAINKRLMDEFGGDLEKWEAEIDADTLSFEFKSPEVLFKAGEITIQPRFEEILSDFFPRYIDVLIPFEKSIDEVRIEGHTSSDWITATSEDEAYFNNMRLSQGRTRSVLNYSYDLPEVKKNNDWVKSNFSAVGFSSSRLVYNKRGNEDREASRRVVFRVVTNAETQIRKILGE